MKEKYEKTLSPEEVKELEEFEASHLDDPQSIKDVINLLIDRKFEFQVMNASMLAPDAPIIHYVPDRCMNQDILLLYVVLGNLEWVVVEDDIDTLTDLFREIEGWD